MAVAREWSGIGEGAGGLPHTMMRGVESSRFRLGDMVGRSAAMERVFLQMRYLAGHLRLLLIEGETGTGKTLAARTLHRLSPYREAGFATIAAEQLLQGREGEKILTAARGGTLYITGLEAAAADAQSRLLQLVDWQQRSQALGRMLPAPRWLGLETAINSPRALILGSRRPLRALVQLGRFRNDLLQEISGAHLVLPPLRDRREDVPLLAEQFLNQRAHRESRPASVLAPRLLEHLRAHHWPGNLGELHSYLEQALPPAPASHTPQAGMDRGKALAPGAPVDGWAEASCEGALSEGASACHEGIPGPAGTNTGGHGSDRSAWVDANLDRMIFRHVHQVLSDAQGNKLRAARLLGISRSTLYRILERRPMPGLGSGEESACHAASL